MDPLYKTDKSKEYFFEEGCHIIELLNAESEESVSFAQARLTPGSRTLLHALDSTVEYYYVTQGCGDAIVNDVNYSLAKGDLLKIKAGETQNIINTGPDDLIFLCICLPRFQPINYRSLEENESE